MTTKNEIRVPAEWEPHDACWVAWPSHGELWEEDLPEAQREFTAFARLIAETERLEVLVPTDSAQRDAAAALSGVNVRFHRIPFGDIWLRDTAPIFAYSGGGVSAMRFSFNGWGKKYLLPHDTDVSLAVAAACGSASRAFPLVLEGGSLEPDGEGTCLTTKQCLLNRNRNPALDQAKIEAALKDSLGFEKILWLDDGLVNDHTDGHIDTLARFVAPGHVVCMHPSGNDDPNAGVLKRIARDLATMTDARGRKLRVTTVPSPGLVVSEEDDVMPASYVNFYIGNGFVAVPTYGTPYDKEAVSAIARLFPGRRTVGLAAKAILTGGGAFHCITQQQPAIVGGHS